MPNLPPDLFQTIVQLCEPHFRLAEDRDAYLLIPLSDWNGVGRIDWTGSPHTFTTRLVHQLPGLQLKKVLYSLLAGHQTKQDIVALCAQIDAWLDLSSTQSKAPLKKHYEELVQLLSSPRFPFDNRYTRLTVLAEQKVEAQKSQFSPDIRRNEADSLFALLAEIEERFVVVLGQPGSGKTTLLYRLQLEHAWAELRKATGQVSFYISLIGYSRSHSDPLAWIAKEFQSHFPKLPDFSALVQDGRLLLLLDDLNKIPHDNKDDYLTRIGQWQLFLRKIEQYGNKVVCSCRSSDYIITLGDESLPVCHVQVESLLPMTRVVNTPQRFFISYKRNITRDQDLAAYLHKKLTEQNHQVFIDTTLRTGTAWLEEIDQQIQQSSFLIVLLSHESAESEMVQAEVRRAYQYRKRQGHPIILPIRVAYDELLPYALDAFIDPLQYAIWRNSDDNERVVQDILMGISGQSVQKKPFDTLLRQQSLVVTEDGRMVADNARTYPPLPEVDPRFLENLPTPGGALKINDRFYIERMADTRLRVQLKRSGSITTIRASRQTGKSSLLVRGIHQARQQGAEVIHLDLQRLDRESLASPDIFLRYLADFIVRRLRLNKEEVTKMWQSQLGPQDKLTYLLEDYVLPMGDKPIVLALDEADRLLDTDFHTDFFGLIRFWNNNAAMNELWERLSIVLVIATEPYLLIADANQSPFNVGLKLSLDDFNLEQVAELNHRHGTPVQAQQLEPLMSLLGGHPYLTRKALYTLASGEMDWIKFVRVAAADEGPFSDHLRRQLWLLKDESELRQTLKEIILTGKCANELARLRLLRAGLIKASGNLTACRCELYRIYLRDRL